MRSKLTTSFTFLALAGLLVCNSVCYGQVTEQEVVPEEKTIAAELADSEDFETLAKAVATAGLDKALEGEGPFTVFAPSEEAFKKMGVTGLTDLLKEENREKLVAILKAHVASGDWGVEKISATSEIPTVDGGSLTVSRRDNKLMVGSATIDHEKGKRCENGLIHCIDEVLPANK